MIRTAAFPGLAACGVLAASAGAEVDWTRHADARTVEILSVDEDGTPRETTIWIVVVDAAAYVRTGATTWGDNVERSPEVTLRVDAEEIPVRAEFVEDDALRERIAASFREKYGWIDGAIAWFRGARPRILRLSPR